jgi:hypothetical protein
MSIIVRIAFFGQPKPVRAIAGQPGVPIREALRRSMVRYSGLAHSSAPPEKQTHG